MDAAELVAQLRESRDALVDAIAGLGPEQAAYRPPGGGWSILQCLEHVAMAESGMFALITRHSIAAAAPGGAGRERELLARGADRSRPMSAPEGAHPSGRFTSLAEAAEYFRTRRERTIDYVTSCREDLRARTVQHPVAGTITCQECLALMASHPARHAEQIREIRRSPGFPA